MKIAVVLNYNNFKSTQQCVDHLLCLGISKAIVVDNCSQNGSYVYLNRYYQQNRDVIVLRNKKNEGYAKGNNIALRFISKHFIGNNDIFIVNPDVKVTKACIDKISCLLNKRKKAGLVTTLMNESTNSAWHHLTPTRALLFNSLIIKWLLYRLFKITEHNTYQILDTCQKVDVVVGAFFGVKQGTFEKIDFFDEGTFLFYEEEILYQKLSASGYQNYLITDESFYHKKHGSTEINKLMFKKINDQSRLYLLTRYYYVGRIYRSVYKSINKADNWMLKKLGRDKKLI